MKSKMNPSGVLQRRSGFGRLVEPTHPEPESSGVSGRVKTVLEVVCRSGC